MNYLLDVNVLVAWGWSEHADHGRVARWIGRERGRPGVRLLTSPIPELGFIRVSVQRGAGAVAVSEACAVLDGMIASLGAVHSFIADDQRATRLPAWCREASRTTDAHLLALAGAHGATLATLDRGIPGSFAIPS